MSLNCDEARAALVDLACGENPAELERTEVEAHLGECPACRDFRRGVVHLFAVGQGAADPQALDWRRFWSTMDRGARCLAAKERLETGLFMVLACAVASGLWAGLGVVGPALPIYLQLGIVTNLSLFFLPAYLSHRRRWEG